MNTTKTALRELVTIQSGHSPSTFQLSCTGGFPYVKVEDMNNCQKYQLYSREYTDDSTRTVPKGAIIFPKRGAAIMNNKVRIAARDLCMDTNMMAIIPNHKIISEYLFYAITYEQIFKIADTSTIPQINNKHINPYKILVPSIKEQKEIVGLISTWDVAIEKTEQLISAKEKRLGALTQDLLTSKKRIKGFMDNWRKYRLSEVLTEHGEWSSGTEEVFSVSVHKGLINQVEHLGRSFAAKDLSNYNLVKPFDIVYTKSPTGDFPYGIIKQSRGDAPVIVSPLYGVFTPRDRQLGTFLDFYFESPVRTKNYLSPIIQKGAKNTINITNSTFLSNKLFLPTCPDETKAIADTLDVARQEIALLEKQVDTYRKQKRGLMQKLLVGERIVKLS